MAVYRRHSLEVGAVLSLLLVKREVGEERNLREVEVLNLKEGVELN